MTYQYGSLRLETVREVFVGEKNDVYVARAVGIPQETFYTVLLVKDHQIAKKCLELLESNNRNGDQSNAGFIDFFTCGTDICILFEYAEERPLETFFNSAESKLFDREQVAIGLVMECISSGLPFPILYLILSQNNVHIKKNQEIFFTYYLDLSELDEQITERECACKCAWIILSILQAENDKKAQSMSLIRKKLMRTSYSSFPELYKDIRLTSVPEKKRGLIRRLYSLYAKNRDGLFRILLVVCIVLVIIALIVLISQIFLGDVPFFRLFRNAFKHIGTETLIR